MAQPRTLFQKVWDNHVVVQEPNSPAVLYIDLQLVHEVTSPQAFDGLRRRGLKVRRPDRTDRNNGSQYSNATAICPNFR